MLKIHTKDGKTHRIDLNDGDQARSVMTQLKRADFQSTITGVSVVQDCFGRVRCPQCGRSAHIACEGCGDSDRSESQTKTGVQYSMSRPDGFGDVFYHVEHIEPFEKIRGGERVTCFAGDSRITMMVHRGQPSVRMTLLRTGRQRYNPITG